MVEGQLVIKYDGGDANQHTVEMRALGLSLIGFERIVSDGLIFMGHGRLPRRRERHQLAVKARELSEGCAEVPIDIAQSLGLLPLGWWLLQTGVSETISQFMTFVFAKLSGRNSEATAAMEALIKMRESDAAERVAQREIDAKERLESQRQWLEDNAAWRSQLYSLTNRLAHAAMQAVTPVGPSVDVVKLNGSAAPPFIIDLATADAIRAKGDLEVTPLREIDLRLDGFVHHTKKLNVENPENPGSFISADIRDPAFDVVPNVYTQTANVKGVLRVQAKLGYRAGILEKIYIMDHGDRLDDAA